MSKPSEEFSLKDHFYGAATVGERGQIVIPVEARKKYAIETGDKILIMGAPHERGLMLVKIEALREFMTTILSDLQTLERELQDNGLQTNGLQTNGLQDNGLQDNGKTEETAS